MCEKSCSGNCLNNAYCDHIDGRCNGCDAGYIGKLCNACKIILVHFISASFPISSCCVIILFINNKLYFSKLVRRDTLAKTVHNSARLIVRHVNPLMEHAAVKLVGWDRTVV